MELLEEFPPASAAAALEPEDPEFLLLLELLLDEEPAFELLPLSEDELFERVGA